MAKEISDKEQLQLQLAEIESRLAQSVMRMDTVAYSGAAAAVAVSVLVGVLSWSR